ncbi:MAG TPA: Na+/H+ antiporter subunit G [Sediminispirochaeta sp.]|nr:Na+/H+ antiporter subunit G [Sediminispirochaeta sp.]
MELLGHILILIGSIFSLLGAFGILRMPDIYNRLQAGTKATTLGALSLILGVGLANPAFLGKSILLILFIVLTNPISSSTIARSGRRADIPMLKNAVVDAYAEKVGKTQAAADKKRSNRADADDPQTAVKEANV